MSITKEDLEQKRDELIQYVETVFSDLIGELETVTELSVQVERTNGRIKVTWSGGNIGEIQWKVEGKENIVSLNHIWNETSYNPPQIDNDKKEYLIGNVNNYEKKFTITIGNGVWVEGDADEEGHFEFEESASTVLPKKSDSSDDGSGNQGDISEPEKTELTVDAERIGDRIKVSWGGGDIHELQWKHGDKDSIISLNYMWNETSYEPPQIDNTTREYFIGNINNIGNSFNITVGTGEWNSEEGHFEFEESASIYLPKKTDSSDDEDEEDKYPDISTNPSDWTVKGEILTNGDYIVAGVTQIGDEAVMLLQNTQKVNGEWTNAGDVLFSKDLENWYEKKENPVLIEPMKWQGQENRIPYRIAPRTLIKWKDTYYTYTRDRLGIYPGIRGVGVFSSKDMQNWNGYNDWFLDVEKAKSKIPSKYLTDNEYERCYLKCATVANDEIYIIVSLEDTEGNDTTVLMKGAIPTDFNTFEFIEAPWHSEGRVVGNLYYINNKWVWIGRGDGGFNTIGIKVTDTLNEPFGFNEGGFEINHSGPRETIFPFFFNGQWHLLYDDNKDGRDIHLATCNPTEKKK